MTFACLNCEDNLWVCEGHPHRPWNGGEGCCGAAGMPCAVCNTGPVPAMEPGTVLICSLLDEMNA